MIDSFIFASDIGKLASFDIVSLFENIPVSETIEIFLNNILTISTALYRGFDRKKLNPLLEICTSDNVFILNEKLYEQRDDVPIGGVSPTIAVIFFSIQEQNWIDQCPTEFKPVFYRTFDDVTLIFSNLSTMLFYS